MHSTTAVAMGTRRGQKNITKTVKFAIIHMVNAGVKQNEVAAKFHLSKSTVSKIMKGHGSNENTVVKKRGRKFKLNAAAIRILQRMLLKNNMKPLHVSVAELRKNYGYKLSKKTVRRYLHKCGIATM